MRLERPWVRFASPFARRVKPENRLSAAKPSRARDHGIAAAIGNPMNSAHE